MFLTLGHPTISRMLKITSRVWEDFTGPEISFPSIEIHNTFTETSTFCVRMKQVKHSYKTHRCIGCHVDKWLFVLQNCGKWKNPSETQKLCSNSRLMSFWLKKNRLHKGTIHFYRWKQGEGFQENRFQNTARDDEITELFKISVGQWWFLLVKNSLLRACNLCNL